MKTYKYLLLITSKCGKIIEKADAFLKTPNFASFSSFHFHFPFDSIYNLLRYILLIFAVLGIFWQKSS